MSLVISLVALVISLTALWLTALRPATLVIDPVPEGIKLGTGVAHGIPKVTEVAIKFALPNLGSKTGLVQSIEVDGPICEGAPEFSDRIDMEPSGGRSNHGYSIDGGRTVTPGDVKLGEVAFGLGGEFRSEQFTERLPELEQQIDRTKFAEQIRDLRRVTVVLVCRYRSGGGVFGRSEKVARRNFVIDGATFQKNAVASWRQHKPELAEIVEPSAEV